MRRTYMLGHESNASIQIGQYFTKVLMIYESTCAGSIESSSDTIQISIVVQVGANFVCQLSQPLLFGQQAVALGLEGRGLGINIAEGI